MLDGFANWLKGIFEDVIQWALDSLVAVLEWFGDKLLWLVEKVWELILAGLASFIEAIPVPSFILNAAGHFLGLPPMMTSFLQYFAVAEGLAMITLALVMRFGLRRIPLIG